MKVWVNEFDKKKIKCQTQYCLKCIKILEHCEFNILEHIGGLNKKKSRKYDDKKNIVKSKLN